jgi:hypothetical protein
MGGLRRRQALTCPSMVCNQAEAGEFIGLRTTHVLFRKKKNVLYEVLSCILGGYWRDLNNSVFFHRYQELLALGWLI